jgi:methenyltetrahydromethanopterin cyclohydrolase
LTAIGRTNDAILYGARVVLYVAGDDASLEEIGPRVPSSSSRDYGEPFSAVFARYNQDFYAVDPLLFSPAEVVFQNLETGRTHAFGGVNHEVLARSFWS